MGDDGGWSCGAGGDSYGGDGGTDSSFGHHFSSSSGGAEPTGISWSSCGLGKEELSQIPWADNDSSGEKGGAGDSGIWEKKDASGVDAGAFSSGAADNGRASSDKNKDASKKELIGPGGGADCCCLL